MSRTEPDFAEPVSPWTRPWFVLSAVFLFVLVAGFLVVVLLPSPGSSPETTSPTGGATTASTATGGVSGEALPTVVPTVAPSDVTWQLVGQSAVPVSASAGPRSVTGGTASGYAHTPQGALVAAAQLSTRAGFSAGKKSWEPTITKQFVPSSDREQLLALLRAQPGEPAAPGELSPIAGFVYQAYSPDTAVIGVVYRAPGGANSYHVLTTTLQWRDGDWMMVAPPGGSWTSVSRPATDLTGVVEWGPR